MKRSVSVLIPAYNEEELIKRTAIELLSYLNSLKKKRKIDSFEIIICINASTDKTEEIAKELSKKHKEIKYFSTPKRGLGIALRKGIEKASKEIIVSFIPADGEVLNDFIKGAVLLIDDYDFLSGSRYLVKSQIRGSSVKRRILSICLAWIIHNFFSRKLSETGTVRIFKKKWAQKAAKECKRDDSSWQIEILYHALNDNLKIKEIPVKIRIKREGGKSKIRIVRETWSCFKTILYFWFALRIHRIKKFLGFKS